MNIEQASPPIEYPTSDGKPMAETDLHRDWMFRLIERLQHHFKDQRVYVSGNLLIFYVEGDNRRHFAPDLFVVKDCDPGRRENYKIWEEGKPPDFALETTSRSTRREDQVWKADLYARLGISEYFLFDPLGEWLDPPLMGYVLEAGVYRPVVPDERGRLFSAQLGLWLRLDEGDLVMDDPVTGRRVKDIPERMWDLEKQSLRDRIAKREAEEATAAADEARVAAEARIQAAEQARAALEAQLRALQDELARLRQQPGGGNQP